MKLLWKRLAPAAAAIVIVLRPAQEALLQRARHFFAAIFEILFSSCAHGFHGLFAAVGQSVSTKN
jgi:hypothetical protein